MEEKTPSITSVKDNFPIEQHDLVSLVNAYEILSEQVTSDNLIKSLMQVIMEQMEASKGYLLLDMESKLSIAAEAFSNKEIDIKLYNKLYEPDYNFIPEKIIEQVKKTKEKIILNDASKDIVYGVDSYVTKNQPKSIACIPIIKKEKLIGIIYLENNSLSGAFTLEKIEILKILATQTSILLENASLFNSLKYSQKQFQDLMDNAAIVIFVKNLDGRYLFVNKQFEKIYKVTKEKVIGITDHDIFPKEFADSFEAHDKRVQDSGKPIFYEDKIPSDFGVSTFVISKFPLLDQDGNLYAIGGMATDISNSKKLEEDLRLGQQRVNFVLERFNYVLAATQDAIYDWDIETGKIWRNEQYERIFNGPNGPQADWWKIHIHPTDFEKITSELEVSFKEKRQLWNQEYRFKRANGDFAFIIDRGFISYNAEGKPIRMIGAFTDITERKQFVDDIERSLALSKATLESTTDGILVVNADEKIIDYNKKFIEMWNVPDSVIQTKDDKELINYLQNQLKESERFASKVKELLASPESESFDILEFKNGKVFERYSKPQKTKFNIVGRVWSFRDITEHRMQLDAEKKKTAQLLFRQQELLKLNSFNIEQTHIERFNKILVSVAKVLEVDRLSICFFNEDRTLLSSTSTYSLIENVFLPGVSFQKNDYPRFFQELSNNRIVDANDALEDPRTLELTNNYLKPFGIVSLMTIPIRTSEKVIGVILHEQTTKKRIWSYEDQAFAYSVADIIMLAVENEDKVKIMNTLIESEQLFKLAVSQLPLLFAVFDTNLRWTMAGGKILESLGLKTETLIGKTLFQTGDTVDINVANHQGALEGKSSNYEYKLGETYLQRYVEPLKNTTGKIVGVISMSFDITDRKKSEKEINELKIQLDECMKNDIKKQPESESRTEEI